MIWTTWMKDKNHNQTAKSQQKVCPHFVCNHFTENNFQSASSVATVSTVLWCRRQHLRYLYRNMYHDLYNGKCSHICPKHCTLCFKSVASELSNCLNSALKLITNNHRTNSRNSFIHSYIHCFTHFNYCMFVGLTHTNLEITRFSYRSGKGFWSLDKASQNKRLVALLATGQTHTALLMLANANILQNVKLACYKHQ